MTISKTLFEYNLAGIYQLTLDGTILDCNEAFAKIIGYNTSEEIIGKDSGSLYQNMTGNRIVDVEFSGNRIKSLESRLKLENGDSVVVLEDAVRVLDHDKNTGTIIGTLLDITDHKRAQQEKIESEQRYRSLIEYLPTAMYTTDSEGYILIYNKAAVELWGREPEVGKDKWCGSFELFDMDGEAIPLEDCPMALTIKDQKPVIREEVIIKRPDGSMSIVQPHPMPVFSHSGKFKGAFNMLIDVTSQNNYIKTIENKNKRLIDIAWMQSHMVRGPLARIMGLVNLMENHSVNRTEDDGLLTLLRNECDQLDKVVKQIVTETELPDSPDNKNLELVDAN